MAVQIRQILEKFPDLVELARGSGEQTVHDIQAATTASDSSLIFISNRHHFKEALETKAHAWVLHKDLLPSVPTHVPVVLTSPNPYLAMAKIGKGFFPQNLNHQILAGPRIHPSAQISASAKLGSNCIVGPFAVIGDHCKIGDNVIIGAHTVIEPHAEIGADSHLHPQVFIAHSCILGQRCEVHPHTTIGTEGFGYAQDKHFNHHRITHYGRVIIEDDVHIGAGVNIDRGTFEDSRIQSGTKIDNHCHFGHNIQIGKNCLVTAGMITAGSATIGNLCVFGGRSSMGGHIAVVDGCQFGALSGIIRPISERGDYAGFPAIPMKTELKVRAALPELPELVKQVREIMKHLGIYQKKEASPQ